MNKNFWIISILAILLSFAGGFFLANGLNRQELETLKTENTRLLDSSKKDDEMTLSDDEIKQKIAEADKNLDNANFQKDLGIALFRYANMKQDSTWLPEVIKLLNRSFEKEPNNFEVIVTLADAYLSFGKDKKDVANVNKSRELYTKAIILKPNDVEVITNLGLTYLPDEKEKALIEFNKSLRINPKHERTLQILEQLKKQ